MVEEKSRLKKVEFKSYMDFLKEFFPKDYENRKKKKIEEKSQNFGIYLADEFLNDLRGEIS